MNATNVEERLLCRSDMLLTRETQNLNENVDSCVE